MIESYKYLGDFSATPPQYSVGMSCHDCRVSWTGCWDNFECPQCRSGSPPSSGVNNLHAEMVALAQDKERMAAKDRGVNDDEAEQ